MSYTDSFCNSSDILCWNCFWSQVHVALTTIFELTSGLNDLIHDLFHSKSAFPELYVVNCLWNPLMSPTDTRNVNWFLEMLHLHHEAVYCRRSEIWIYSLSTTLYAASPQKPVGCALLDIRHCSWSTHEVNTWTGQFCMKQRDNKGKCFQLLLAMAIWYGTMRYTVDLQQYWSPHSFPVGDTWCITCKLPKSNKSRDL